MRDSPKNGGLVLVVGLILTLIQTVLTRICSTPHGAYVLGGDASGCAWLAVLTAYHFSFLIRCCGAVLRDKLAQGIRPQVPKNPSSIHRATISPMAVPLVGASYCPQTTVNIGVLYAPLEAPLAPSAAYVPPSFDAGEYTKS